MKEEKENQGSSSRKVSLDHNIPGANRVKNLYPLIEKTEALRNSGEKSLACAKVRVTFVEEESCEMTLDELMKSFLGESRALETLVAIDKGKIQRCLEDAKTDKKQVVKFGGRVSDEIFEVNAYIGEVAKALNQYAADVREAKNREEEVHKKTKETRQHARAAISAVMNKENKPLFVDRMIRFSSEHTYLALLLAFLVAIPVLMLVMYVFPAGFSLPWRNEDSQRVRSGRRNEIVENNPFLLEGTCASPDALPQCAPTKHYTENIETPDPPLRYKYALCAEVGCSNGGDFVRTDESGVVGTSAGGFGSTANYLIYSRPSKLYVGVPKNLKQFFSDLGGHFPKLRALEKVLSVAFEPLALRVVLQHVASLGSVVTALPSIDLSANKKKPGFIRSHLWASLGMLSVVERSILEGDGLPAQADLIRPFESMYEPRGMLEEKYFQAISALREMCTSDVLSSIGEAILPPFMDRFREYLSDYNEENRKDIATWLQNEEKALYQQTPENSTTSTKASNEPLDEEDLKKINMRKKQYRDLAEKIRDQENSLKHQRVALFARTGDPGRFFSFNEENKKLLDSIEETKEQVDRHLKILERAEKQLSGEQLIVEKAIEDQSGSPEKQETNSPGLWL